MSRFLPALLFFILPYLWQGPGVHCFSQTQYTLSNYSLDSAKMAVGAIGEFSLNSNGLNNLFFHEFTKKDGYLSSEIKTNVSNNLHDFNQFGGDLNYGVFFSQKLDSLAKRDSIGYNYFIGIHDRSHFDGIFPKDLFDFIFSGNKQFAGDTAYLDNFGVNYFHYQQLQAGLVRTNAKGEKLGLGVSFLKGQSYYSVNAGRFRIFTDERGDSIDAEAHLQITQSNTANKGFGAFNGWGISIDLFYEFEYDLIQLNENFSGRARLEINDVGFINWDNKTITERYDTTFHFEGFKVDDIINFNDSDLLNINADTLQPKPQYSNAQHSMFLPSSISFTIVQQLNKHTFTLGMLQRVPANFRTLLYFKEHYQFSEMLSAGATFGFGGYGKWQLGIDAAIKANELTLVLGTNNLEGLLFKKYSGGNSLFIALQKQF